MKRIVLLALSLTFSILFSYSQALGDYRSIATGNWNVVTTWQTFNGAIWVAAGATPINSDGVVTIRSPNTVTINNVLTIDQVVIDPGATLTNTGGTLLTISNSGMPVGSSELIINGTFIENGTTSISFNAGATWSIAAGASLIKQRNTGSNNWQGAYEGGIATIPATSNWILRKVAAAQPQITTLGAFYGNLIFENNAGGTWTTTAGASFQGAGGFPTIKGNLDIGGGGANPIVFLNGHTNATPTTVIGNVIVRAGHTFQNYGTGLEIQGNLTNNGTISYDANDGRNLNFSGAAAQSLTNTGTLNIFNFGINKSANSLTLNNLITVDNLATFTNGVVNSTIANLFILNTAATVTVIPTTSFVNGPVRRIGPTGIIFPVGKVATYRPIQIGNGAGGASFWTENFGTGCNQGLLASSFTGVNGTWSTTNTGLNGAQQNLWYVSAKEAGMGAGNCGFDGCIGGNTNQTLHVSSIASWAGDLGAAYEVGCGPGCFACDAFGICAFANSNVRAESPIINCTGQTNFQLSFNYMENGQGVTDNATLWYFDGAVWVQLVDLPKTLTTCSPQGLWTAYSIAMPASANNNPNVRIGFNWTNDNDAVGTDPSFAVDDISLGQPTSMFTAEYFPNNPQVPFGNVLVPTLNSLSNCEYWTVNRDVGTEARTIGLSWNAATCFNTAFASFEVARWDNISGIWQDHDGIVVGAAGGGTVTTPLTVGTFNPNNPFAIAYVPLPLPIELIDFNGSCDNGLVKLNWQTSSETNNDYFLVEKSADMQHWHEVARMEGAGNSNTTLSYSLSDAANSKDIYYRLTQFDFNGDSKSFDPISIYCEGAEGTLVIYPNPSIGMFNISIGDKTRLDAVTVYSALGQLVTNVPMLKSIGKTVVSIDLSGLNSGTYYLRMLVNDEWITKSITIVK